MNTCQELDESLTLLATGALEPPAEALVRVHLDTCALCRRELSARRRVLEFAAPPAPSPREPSLQLALPQATRGHWRQAQVRRARHLRTAGGLLAAAAVLLFVLGPTRSRRFPRAPAASVSTPLTTPLAEATAEEETLALEQWALADPLSDALEGTDSDPGDELDVPAREGSGAWDVDSDDFLSSPSLGESL